MQKHLTTALVGIICLIAGYLIGGWVYEVAGGTSWQAIAHWIERYETLSAGIVAAGAAIWAARRAWQAVLNQIRADDDRHRRQANERRIANADAISSLLFQASAHLVRSRTRMTKLPDYVVTTLVNLMVPAMEIDGRLGAALGGFLGDARDHDNSLHVMTDTGAEVLSTRFRLLGDGFQTACRMLETTGSVSPGPLLDRERIAEVGGPDFDEQRLSWLRLLMSERTL